MSAFKGQVLRHGKKFLILLVCFFTVFVILTIFDESVSGVRQMAPMTDSRKIPNFGRESEKRNTADGMSRNSPTRVLIVAYYRSGSSLVGSIFYDFEEAFYNFEPLYPLYERTIKSGRPLTYFNNITSKCPDGEEEDRPIAKDILSAALDCRFKDFDVDAINLMLCQFNSLMNSSSNFCDCKNGTTQIYIQRNCIPNYSKLCLKSAYRVIKTIRVDMGMVESLLEIYPDLKIIHLLRDPRGRVCSGVVARNCNVAEKIVQEVCEIGTRDVLKRKRLEEKYPASFKEVIYEDMVAHPIRISEDIFTFVGAKLPNYIKVLLQEKTQNGDTYNYGNHGPYGTYRKNGLETAYKWSKSIPWSVMEHVNRHCEKFLELGKFPKIRTKEELLSFKIPDRGELQGNLK